MSWHRMLWGGAAPAGAWPSGLVGDSERWAQAACVCVCMCVVGGWGLDTLFRLNLTLQLGSASVGYSAFQFWLEVGVTYYLPQAFNHASLTCLTCMPGSVPGSGGTVVTNQTKVLPVTLIF